MTKNVEFKAGDTVAYMSPMGETIEAVVTIKTSETSPNVFYGHAPGNPRATMWGYHASVIEVIKSR